MRLPEKENLKERFAQYTDEQLMDVLRNHRDYQEQAVEVAVEIALQRKLINSGQDLYSPEFNRVQVPQRKLFPDLNKDQNTKMLSVLFRIIYLMAAIPLIFAVLSFAESNGLKIILWGSGAAAWVAVTWLMEKKRNDRFVFLLVVLFFCFHIIWFASVRPSLKPAGMDLVIYVMAVVLFFYLTGYLYILLRRKKNG